MSSQFPGALDNFTNPTSSDNLNTPAVLHSDQHANENDAIEAIEAWIGISGTSTQSSHEYRLRVLELTPAGSSKIVAWDEGVFVGSGTVLNFVGENVEASISGSVIRVFVTGSGGGGAVVFPQELIGVMGWNQGTPLGTGTVLNVNGNAALSLSGTVFQLFVPYPTFPQDNIGLFGQDEGLNVGTGTILNVTGDNVQLSLSGSILNLHHTNPSINFPQEVIGVVGVSQGTSLGTGTTLHVSGTRINLTKNGDILELTNSPDPAELIGIYGLSNGVPLGTGTWLDFGNNLSASISGTVIRLNAQAGGGGGASDGIGVMGWDEGIPLGTGSVLNVVGENISLSISGTTLTIEHSNPAVAFPQELIGIMGQDEGVPFGTGSTLNVVGSNIALSLSGSVLQLSHTDTPVTFPQDNIGFFGQNKAVNLGTGTTLNVNGSRLVITLSGTVFDLSNSPDPVELIGLVGMSKSTSLGTGTSLNVSGTRINLTKNGDVLELTNSPDPQELIGVMNWSSGAPLGTGTTIDWGDNLTASLSGTTLRVDASAGQGTPFSGVDQIGIFGNDGGVPVGTGTILNVTGNRAVLSRSGTVLELNISPDPVELIGIMGINQGSSLGTGTTLSVTGSRISMSLVGNILNLTSPEPQELIGVFGQYNATNLGTGTAIDFEIGMRAAITGTTLYVNPFGGTGSHGQTWVFNTGSAHSTSWKDDDYNIQFHIGDGTNVISTGSISAGYAYVEVPVNSDIQSWAVYGDATGSIVTNVFKSTYAGFPPASPLAGLGQPLMTNLRKNTGNATGTASLQQGDVLLLSVSSVSTLKLATIALRARKTAAS